jgi:tetratricopeptide (TPR) repeat protein
MKTITPRSLKAGFAALACALALSACSPPPDAPPATTKVVTPPRDLVAEVRATGADAGDSLDVQPLRDPVIEDLRAAASRFENAKQFADADDALARALKITPNDPELLQHRAEVALARAQYELAEKLANSSYEMGPKLGGLCRRNWATIRVSREMRGQADGASTAGTQGQRCTVEPPVRM